MANDIEKEIETTLNAGILPVSVQSKDDETVWSGRIHSIDLLLLHKFTSFSLLWPEKLSVDSKLCNLPSTPALQIAQDLIRTKIAQILISISRTVGALCYHGLSLLAHNINPHILENLISIASLLETEWKRKTDEAYLYGRLGATIGTAIHLCRKVISRQDTAVPEELDFENAPEPIDSFDRAQDELPDHISTTTTTPGVMEPDTPKHTDPVHFDYIAVQSMDKGHYEVGESGVLMEDLIAVKSDGKVEYQ
jgi:hypothetical protein